jgi:cytidyltransferase-like protein
MFKRKGHVIVAVSGGFDPIHIGHVAMIEEAAKYGDLVVIVNNDNWIRAKKGKEPFMPEEERLIIVQSIKGVKNAFLTFHGKNPTDMSVAAELAYLKPNIFCNGGDRKEGCIPSREECICSSLNIKMLYGVGGEKIQSSSELVDKASWRRIIIGE